MQRGEEIDHSFHKLRLIKKAGVFKNVGVGTHRHSFFNEGESKKHLIEASTEVTVFTIPIKIPKSTALKASGNILVDDSQSKIEDWVNHMGIGVLFMQKDDNNQTDYLLLPTLERPYYITNNILNVLKIAYFENIKLLKVNHKKLIK